MHRPTVKNITQAELAQMHKTHARPLCACCSPSIEMYIAKIADNYIIKRMPNTGHLHSPDCDSYDPPAELSGIGEIYGSAIKEDMEGGSTELKFGFTLSKGGTRKKSSEDAPEETSVKTDGNRLTLASTLHYLWEQAGFHKWTPAMSGKRNWGVIRKHLLSAMDGKLAKGRPLSDQMYIPEPFSIERKDAIAQKRLSYMLKLASTHKTRPLSLLIGELKEIAPSRYGHKIIIKHTSDYGFLLASDIRKRLLKLFVNELTMWNEQDDVRLIVIATFGIDEMGCAAIEEISLMPVTSNWIPFETYYDKAVIAKLTVDGRKFTKTLRYNMSRYKPLACAVLTDTLPLPYALYITPIEADDDFIHESETLRESSHLDSWVWDISQDDFEIPEFPPSGNAAKELPASETEHSAPAIIEENDDDPAPWEPKVHIPGISPVVA